MHRPLIVLLALSISLLGGLSAWTLAASADERSSTSTEVARLSADVARLEQAVSVASAQQAELTRDRSRMLLLLDTLDARLRTEQPIEARTTAGGAPGVAEPAAADGPGTGTAQEAAAAGRQSPQAEFLALLAAGVLDDGGSREQQERFWELCRTTPVLGELIADLEAQVEADPGDVAARMQLADAYVAKLLTVPGGPERGLWSERAEQQWKSIAATDQGHWESRFALGENYSYYPPFMNKAAEALSWLGEARALQGALPPQPAFARTYALIARVQQQQGQAAAARATLQDGLRLYPDDAELLAALASLP